MAKTPPAFDPGDAIITAEAIALLRPYRIGNDRTLDRLAKRGKIARIPTPFIRPRLWSRRSIIQFLESAK
jgi:hypothetical protein